MSNKTNKYGAILCLSGGIDSTASMYKWLLENPNKKLLVFHLKMVKSRFGRHKKEYKAVKNILKWFESKGLSNFDFVESSFYYKSIPGKLQDIELVGAMIGGMLRSSKNDISDVIISASSYDLGLPGYELRANSRYALIELMARRKPNYIYPIIDMDREDLVNFLPEDLLGLTWFCRTPKKQKPCGKCATCLNTLPYLEKLKSKK